MTSHEWTWWFSITVTPRAKIEINRNCNILTSLQSQISVCNLHSIRINKWVWLFLIKIRVYARLIFIWYCHTNIELFKTIQFCTNYNYLKFWQLIFRYWHVEVLGYSCKFFIIKCFINNYLVFIIKLFHLWKIEMFKA